MRIEMGVGMGVYMGVIAGMAVVVGNRAHDAADSEVVYGQFRCLRRAGRQD
jgi:hypothetical protein